MLRSLAITATPAEAGMRLDLLLAAHFPSSSRAFVREAIAAGDITVNGANAVKGYRVREGDAIAVASLYETTDNSVRPNPDIVPQIVFDDGLLIGVDKPSGMPVQPLSPRETGTLANGMVALRPELSLVGNEPLIAGAVHRIDAGTSGLVVFAANNFVFASMRSLFSTHKVEKTYLALVEGEVARPGAVECDLAHDPRAAFCRMVRHDSLTAAERAGTRPLPARTSFSPVWAASGRTLLRVTIETGVTHQIRAQLAMAGHPIVGDAIYGGKPADGLVPAGAFCLHSLSASFLHPATGEPTLLSVPPPAYAANRKLRG